MQLFLKLLTYSKNCCNICVSVYKHFQILFYPIRRAANQLPSVYTRKDIINRERIIMQDYIRINAIDNVAVALSPLSKGLIIKSSESGFPHRYNHFRKHTVHKFALTAINAGDRIIKYGSPIGVAVSNITSGSHVHVHNIKPFK